MKNIIKTMLNYNKNKRKNLKEKKQNFFLFDRKKRLNFKSKRNNFKVFKTKLKYENYKENFKNIYLYYFILWIVLCFLSIYLLFFSHYFQIKNINIIINDEYININMAYKAVDNFRYNSTFFVDKKLIEEKIKYYQPNIKELKIQKILPDLIKITLISYDVLFKTTINKKSYLISENWVFIPSNKENDLENLDIIWLDFIWIIDYKKIILTENIKNIDLLIKKIKESNSFIMIKELKYYKKEQELHIITNDKITIIFDLQKDIISQVEKLNIFYKEKKNIKEKIIYIDLRIDEKIIYCDSSNEFQCKKNLKKIYN